MGRKRVRVTDTISTPAAGHDLREAGRRMGISEHTVRALVRQRALAHYRIERRIVLLEPDIDAFMAKRRVVARDSRPA
jgi:hypothetical protein